MMRDFGQFLFILATAAFIGFITRTVWWNAQKECEADGGKYEDFGQFGYACSYWKGHHTERKTE